MEARFFYESVKIYHSNDYNMALRMSSSDGPPTWFNADISDANDTGSIL